MEWLAWWNLVFELPVAAASLLAFTAAFGADSSAGHHDADLGHDVGDHDLTSDHSVDTEVHALPGETSADAEGHALTTDHDASDHEPITTQSSEGDGSGWISALLALPGADRAPVTLVLMIMCLSFGIIGLIVNQLLAGLLRPHWYVWISFAVAAIGSVVVSRTFARTFAKFLPKTETYATSRRDCVGQTGSITALMAENEGFAQVYDCHQNLLEVRVRAFGATRFQQGSKILLVDYDEQSGGYLADLFDPSSERLSSRATTDLVRSSDSKTAGNKTKSSRNRKERE